MSAGQGLDDAVLAAVGVLILVDQQVIEAGGLGGADFLKSREQVLDAQEQVVEVHGPGGLQGLLIAAIAGRRQVLLVGLGQRGRLLGAGRKPSSSGR